jgi:nitroreductase
MPVNVEKVRTSPVTAIIAYDTEFYEKLPKLVPHMDARSFFAGNAPLIHDTAFRNGSLQGAYLIIAARANGLDCGPMSGFDASKVNAEFFPDGKWKANFLCNLGHGDATNQFPRAPRLDFEEACQLL